MRKHYRLLLLLGKFLKSNVVLIVLLIITITSVFEIVKLLGRDDTLQEAAERVKALEEEQKNLLEMKENVESQEFIEREARERLGLAKEGEVVLVLPPDDTLRRLSPDFEDEEEDFIKPPIWKRWIELFF